ncbi:unnamed protein product [Knipowitschia caucasica]
MLPHAHSSAACAVAAVLVLLTLHLVQTEAAVLRKSEVRDGAKEEHTSRIWEGRIVFGTSANRTGSDDYRGSYQADAAAFDPIKQLLWKQIQSSVVCGPNSMRFRATGAPVQHFDLGQHPAGHVERTPHGLSVYIPYKGCYIVYEDGTYNYPLNWYGVPLTLKCPKPLDGATPTAPHFPWFPTTTAAPVPLPHFPHFPPYWPLFPTEPPTSRPPHGAYLEHVLHHLLQFLQNQGISIDSPQAAVYLQYLLPLLLQNHLYTPQVPPHKHPWYHLLQHAAPAAPSAPQNPLEALWGLPLQHGSTSTGHQFDLNQFVSLPRGQTHVAPPHYPLGQIQQLPVAPAFPHPLPQGPHQGPPHRPWAPPPHKS